MESIFDHLSDEEKRKLGIDVDKVEKEIKEKKNKNSNKYKDHQPTRVAETRSAVAPYNFVPLNKKVISAKLNEDSRPSDFDRYYPERLSGYIELDIKALTPLYVRDCLTEDDHRENQSSKEKKDNPDFFSPSGRPAIPGSSLRGMLRTMIEIVTYSRFQFYNKGKLYFRGMADVSNLRQYYTNRMTDQSLRGVAKYKINAGYLIKTGVDFFILPAIEKNGTQFTRYDESKYGPHNLKSYHYRKMNGTTSFLLRSGRKVHPRQRERDVWLINEPGAISQNATGALPADELENLLKLSSNDVQSYVNDTTRGADIDLVKKAEKQSHEKFIIDRLVPCFYVEEEKVAENQKGISIGHTALFRIAYRNSVENLVTSFQESAHIKIDIAESLFGTVEQPKSPLAGRIFVEDAVLVQGEFSGNGSARTPKILSTPKPTTFQHYLVQQSDNNKNLQHYDSNTTIRGYKGYWHKAGDAWEEKDKDAISKHNSQYSQIKPIDPGAQFKCRVRFENITKAELGALLSVLKLPEGCAHKIGMGKPLGLGSIEIVPKVYVSGYEERYSDFLSGWSAAQENHNILSEAQAEFLNRLIKELDLKNIKSIWDIDRLREFRIMLSREAGKQLEKQNKTRYMQIAGENEFKDRRVLPKPSQLKT